MGFLKFFSKTGAGVQRLPSGSLTVDRNGKVVMTTVSSTYPPALLREISTEVLRLFRDAREAHLPLSEFNLHFASLRITARELRGGAIIFLTPKTQSPGTASN
ncbi:MAG: hypothetical protein U1F98_02195 [Verrucomicrobiota bacterium]